MTRLLHIQSSPRGESSFSLAVADAFLEAFREANPEADVDTLDLWRQDLPPMQGAVLAAKDRWMAGEAMTAEQAAAWAPVEALARQFREADGYLFSVPMWSFGVPYPLKHYLDVITQPGLLFHYDPETAHRPLLGDRPAYLVCARGDRYGPGSPYEGLDYQASWLADLLRFVGIRTVHTVLMEPTEGDSQTVDAALQHARKTAAGLGRAFPGPGT
ncbi:FMN-dependent NADH-azoreductase [Thiohalorhabdus sp. Cl-TMA]|uniref:FMN dependent NADH:quinone oxidoreductase n=1 Tax=Thiohalorhabdus methylotrophus TaxID=3242694 RepID=A0ABV4TQV5_9GAMM